MNTYLSAYGTLYQIASAFRMYTNLVNAVYIQGPAVEPVRKRVSTLLAP